MAQQQTSPLTGILEEDQVFIDFGEHEGKSVLEINDTCPDFYQFLVSAREGQKAKISLLYFIRNNDDLNEVVEI